MLFQKFRRKIFKNNNEEKSLGFFPQFNILNQGYGFAFAQKSSVYLQYYNQVAPVGDSINKLAQEAANVKVYPYKLDGLGAAKPLVDSKFCKKFDKPNDFQSGLLFRLEGMVHYLATGNNYIYLKNVLNAEKDQIVTDPSEVKNLRPDYITIIPDENYYPHSYQYSPSGVSMQFTKQTVKNRNGEWENMFVEKNGYGVLVHFKEPSTTRTFGFLYGDSLMQDIELEIMQYLQASVHNSNLLKNGLSAKLLFSPKDSMPMSKEQLDQVSQMFKEKYSGSNSSGGTIVTGIPFDVKQLDLNLKDMDFKGLMQRVRVAIYNKFNVPLPLVEGEFTATSNIEKSTLNFYDKGILPLLNKRNDFFYNFIYKPFFKEDKGVYGIDYDKTSIVALQTRIFENVIAMQKGGVVTLNEMREYQGLDSVKEGGNTLFIDANKAPVAGDDNLTDGIGMPARSIAQEANDVLQGTTSAEKQALKEILQKHKDIFGKRLYTDEEIKSILN